MTKYNILFFPDKVKNCPYGYLRMRVRWHKYSYTVNLGYQIDFDKWVKTAQRAKSNSTHGKKKVIAVVINKEIEKQTAIICDCFNYFELIDKLPTKEDLIALYAKKLGKFKESDIIDEFETFVRTVEIENSWTHGTKQKFNTVFNKFKFFSQIKSVSELNESILRKYVDYLVKNNYKNVTINKEVKCIMQFVRWCESQGKVAHFTFNTKLKNVQKTIVFLTNEELTTIYNTDFNKNYLNRAKDLFCFCCFTGLRYSDMSKVTKANVYDKAIHIVTKKTDTTVTIELNKYSLEILEKYDYELPIISNVKLNKYLKTIGRQANINSNVKLVYYIGGNRFEKIVPKWELLTTHCGRRTFVCNALALGISPQVIMKWTGHSDINSMKPYMDIADNFRRSEMNKFDNI